ncbi:MAG: glycosyltransferase family 88 protein [Legionella sp.]|uniref:glycosyltransferase family 88 protein n=1 Tax=Legionella sp. TaxID=459 RepID=UPI002844AC0C|nr:glycosyltransferase family 88 protein [Legionella sp.]
MNTYRYNPHHHIKIWLSNNRDLFMNLENQIRLSKMRETNLSDVIYLIYDSLLLNSKAIQDLMHYCQEHRIIPVDIRMALTEIVSDNEQKLFHFYNDEITHLNQGGNLAVASDILRWLSPLYKLGTYSDFDYPIDTSALPELINVDAPLLLNIGSLKLGSKEFILANNDFIAVVDEQAAGQLINKVHHNLLAKLTHYDNDFNEKVEKQFSDTLLSRYIIRLMRNRPETLYIAKSKDLKKQPELIDSTPLNSSRSYRNYIQQIMASNDLFLRFNKQGNESSTDTIQRLRNELEQNMNLVKFLFFNKEYTETKQILQLNNDDFLTCYRKKEINLYLKSIIVCTTGPVEIANALFGKYVMNSPEFINEVQVLSFNHYQLQHAFKSPNSIPLHENPLGMMKFLGASEGEVNDSSWLESGKQLQEARIKTLKAQKDVFSSNLSQSLLSIKKDIEANLQKISNPLFKKRNETQKQLLNAVLDCFHEEQEYNFDVDQFHSILLKTNDQVAHLYFSPTKRLIQDLQKLSHEAVVLGLTQQRKIILDVPDEELRH